MEDKLEAAIAGYDLAVRKRYRSRGGWMLETTTGPYLLREYESIRSHFDVENKIKKYLIEHDFDCVDEVILNHFGEPVTELETGEKYVLYRWSAGDACDLKSEKCLTKAGENLGRFHKAICQYADETTENPTEENLLEQFSKHNRELKRVNGYMKSKKRKTEFEIYAINCFEEYYEKAQEAARKLEACSYYNEKNKEKIGICHGDYNYHNLIATQKGMFTTGFERAGFGIQLLDLTYFLRKTLEKNEWDRRAGAAVMNGYNQSSPLSDEQIEFIYVILMYPEKYWKLMNHYYNKKKSWLSAKSLEKLKNVRSLEKNRQIFLGGQGAVQ